MLKIFLTSIFTLLTSYLVYYFKFKTFNHDEQVFRHYMEIEKIADDPKVLIYKNFVSHEEADHLIEVAKPLLNPSLVLDGGDADTAKKYRTSTSAYLEKTGDEIIK